MYNNPYQDRWDRIHLSRLIKYKNHEKAVQHTLTKAKKVCTHCKQEKSFSDFDEDSRSMTGYASVCKECKSSRRKKG
jgi:superfamily II helicase